MPVAPNLATLEDFEGNFELAAQTILTAAGVVGFISQQAGELPLINTGISADLGAAIELGFLPSPPGWTGESPPQDWTRFPLSLAFRVEVPRDQNTPSTPPLVDTVLRTIRAQIRAAMLRVLEPFDDTNLPYYRVSDIKPNGSATGFEPVRNIDFTELRFSITFSIQPDAWPAWTP